MSKVDLAKVPKQHRREKLVEYWPGKANCHLCGQLWPCDAIQLAEEVERLWEALEKIEPPQDTVRLLPARPMVVTLCGSTRFMDAFFEVGWELTLQGKIVLSVGVCKHAEDHGGEALGGDVCERLDELHWRKIDLSDEIMVLNIDGYIGKSTQAEIEYAERVGKRVLFLEEPARAALSEAPWEVSDG